MINIKIDVSTDANGKLTCHFEAVGFGSEAEKDLAVNIVGVAEAMYHLTSLQQGGTPRTTIDPRSRITNIGQG